jgi:hypothetical protein
MHPAKVCTSDDTITVKKAGSQLIVITQSRGLVRVLAGGLFSAMLLVLLRLGYLAWAWLEAADWVWLDLFKNQFKSRKRR